MDIRCQHFSTYAGYSSSAIVTATLKRPTTGPFSPKSRYISCVCSMVTPNASGHDQHVSEPNYASIECTMIITRCPILTLV